MDNAIKLQATPGGVILISKNGKIVYEKAYGTFTYSNKTPVNTSSVYDVASVTKILATTLAVMKLYDEGRLSLNDRLSKYLPELDKTNKKFITIREVLNHASGLVPGVSVKRPLYNRDGELSEWYRLKPSADYFTEVAENLYLRDDWLDSIWRLANISPLGSKTYRYSDIGFLYLGRVIEKITNEPLNIYVHKTFYAPMGLTRTGFMPLSFLTREEIVPSELDYEFRNRLILGYVNDPTVAMLGGVGGSAGLFSTAQEMNALMQMLMSNGRYKNVQYIKPETIKLFTGYQNGFHRGLGFDKPRKTPYSTEPYPAKQSSPATFGHTGFTGTCAWADPEKGIVFIFLSNRLYPNGNRKLNQMNIREKLLEAAYNAFP